MANFLWVQDFDNNPLATAKKLFTGLVSDENFPTDEDKEELCEKLLNDGIYIKLTLLEGLQFIKNPEQLAKVDYIILDIDLDIQGNFPDDQGDLNEIKKLYNDNLAAIKKEAGYYLYITLVMDLGFPQQNIIFFTNHGDQQKSIIETFEKAKVKLPKIYQKNQNYANNWVKECHQNEYITLRRGIYEGCNEILLYLENNQDAILINEFIKGDEHKFSIDDLKNYLNILNQLLPLRIPSAQDKKNLYKIFIRTLSHEWEAVKNIHGNEQDKLAWIMKNTRNWITHNSNLFSDLDEQMVAYLFMINMRNMFKLDDNQLMNYEKILFNLFESKENFEQKIGKGFYDRKIPIIDAYLDLKNIIREEQKNFIVEDGFHFNELANNLQMSDSPLKNEKTLFIKIFYQMFWLITSNPFVDYKKNLLEIKFGYFNYRNKAFYYELGRHIYINSFE